MGCDIVCFQEAYVGEDSDREDNGDYIPTIKIYPDPDPPEIRRFDPYKAPLPNADMPEDVKEDYLEASSILTSSPRSAAALLRLATEKLLKLHLGQKGKDMNEIIGNLVKEGLPVRIQKALDILRVIGNEAVHPGVIDLRDDRRTVSALFRLINLIVQDRITEPREIDELYKKLPENKIQGIEVRDAKALKSLDEAYEKNPSDASG
jgi:hypothetical protein